ncbi:BnaC02g45270D [Brassica napus]|uniref:BnaC02g45270D protein n=4 Tax=Brassica TaxID=3705 RepID=A0A078JAK3_BRANA|nr:PREDICTED: uncharacterized protein LOC106326362 [Brassica oleracea var. oleracea]XP_048604174.1 uncharacterized protein LOC125581948 [Brassica napus]CDY60944.1 BnaC02g45270D [Brassica napus]VDD22016.1 unnamed protein product [Brassica oleracea]
MGPKTSHKVALLFSLLLLILTISSQARVIEAASRKLASGRNIVYTPSSKSCGATHATWKKKKRGPCRRPPRTAPASYQSP